MRQSESIPVLPASRAHALVAVLVAAGLAAAGAPDAAQAGSFRISACGPANATFTAAQNSPLYTVNQTCPKKDRPGAGTGLDVATASFGGLVGYFYSATWTVTAPPAAVFGQMSFNRYVQRVNENWTVALGADNGAGGGGVFLDGFAANDGSGAHDSAAWQPRVVNAGGRTRINAGVLCGNPSGCGTTIGQVRARYAIADVDLEVIDSTVPSVALGGPLTAGGWVGRQARLDVLATDNVGIRMLSAGGGEQQKGLPISADNGKVPDPVLDLTCYYDRPKPCADINDYYNIDLTPLPDGPSQPFVVMAIDAANNFVRTAATINVDNTAPTAPLEVTVAGGDAWKQTNSFSVSWRNPVQSAAPIVAARYQLCRAVDGAGCIEGRQTGPNLASLQDIKVPGVGEWRLRIALEDAAGNYALVTGADAILRFDNLAPAPPIFQPVDPNDPTSLAATAGDQGSGVTSGTIAFRQVGSSGPWQPLPTTVNDGMLRARLDDRRLRPATYELAATAVDGAGNATTSDRRVNGSKAELTAPLRVPMQVRLANRPVITTKQTCGTKRVRNRAGRLVKKRVCRQVAVRPPRPLRSLRIAFGKRRQIFGVLTSRDGRPLAGAQVILRARAGRLGAQTQRIATVKTNSGGRFSYLARGTQSRRLLAIYPGTATIGYAAAQANVRVPAKVKLRSTPTAVRNGKSTTFTGRLVGGPIPPNKLVALQVIVRGEWRPFRTVRADASGRFEALYRFALTRTTSRYRFRALVPREATYPYDTGASRPLNVLVRP